MTINTSYICDGYQMDLIIRNNINGDYSLIENIYKVEPGAFININWKNKNLMLPYSLKKGSLSFSDKKWNFRYSLKENGEINENEPTLYQLKPLGENIEYKCKLNS